MIILVTGGRDFADGKFVWASLDDINAIEPITFVVEGGAGGVDTYAQTWRTARNVDGHTEHANWDRYRNNAGRVRNCRMLREHKHHLDAVVAFPGGTGTSHMRSISKLGGVPVIDLRELDAIPRFFESYKPRTLSFPNRPLMPTRAAFFGED